MKAINNLTINGNPETTPNFFNNGNIEIAIVPIELQNRYEETEVFLAFTLYGERYITSAVPADDGKHYVHLDDFELRFGAQSGLVQAIQKAEGADVATVDEIRDQYGQLFEFYCDDMQDEIAAMGKAIEDRDERTTRNCETSERENEIYGAYEGIMASTLGLNIALSRLQSYAAEHPEVKDILAIFESQFEDLADSVKQLNRAI